MFEFSTAVSWSLSRLMRLDGTDWLRTSRKSSTYPSLCSAWVSSDCPFLDFTGTCVLIIFPVRFCKTLYILHASLFTVAFLACWHLSSIHYFLLFLQLLFIALLILLCSWLKSALFSWVMAWFCLTLSWQRSKSYRNHLIDLLCKSVDWLLYYRDLRHKRVKHCFFSFINKSPCFAKIRCSFRFPLFLSIVFWDASSLHF